MILRLFQVDAFAERPFEGNPAAVVPLEEWLDESLLQSIAEENHLSETAFFVPENGGYELRWFTPEAEVDLCGHATLAAAHVLFTHLGHAGEHIAFSTRSGVLEVTRDDGGYSMDFPALPATGIDPPAQLAEALGASPDKVLMASDLIAVFSTEEQVRAIGPDFSALGRLPGRGVLVTAPGSDCDFVSRCFFPGLGVNEDPVTGSAHCELAPLWAQRLGRDSFFARQLSRRGGSLRCTVTGERVVLSGRAVDYLIGEIRLT